MLKMLLTVCWYFLPAALANSSPTLIAKVPVIKRWSYPLDGYRSIGGKRILGDHKTVRGIVTGVVMGMLTAYLQLYIWEMYPALSEFVLLDYSVINPILFGFLMGFGAIGGDAVKSFIKRRLNRKPGSAWIPFDQIDYILGGALLTVFYFPLPDSAHYILLLFFWVGVHLLTNFTAYHLGIKDVPY